VDKRTFPSLADNIHSQPMRPNVGRPSGEQEHSEMRLGQRVADVAQDFPMHARIVT
jgi:hypothetical protein